MPYKDKTEHADALKRYRQRRKQAVEEAKKVLSRSADRFEMIADGLEQYETLSDTRYKLYKDFAKDCEEAAKQLSPTTR